MNTLSLSAQELLSLVDSNPVCSIIVDRSSLVPEVDLLCGKVFTVRNVSADQLQLLCDHGKLCPGFIAHLTRHGLLRAGIGSQQPASGC